MAYANPHYDPEWKAAHDRHAVERARAEAERDRLAKSGAMLSDAYRQAEAEFDHHQQACLASFKTQHATVQEYAAWVFREFKVSSGDWEGGIPVPVVDFEQLSTIEEADAAWSRVHRIVSDSAAERRGSLPTGQPHPLLAGVLAAGFIPERLCRGCRDADADDGRCPGRPLARVLHARLGQRGRQCDQRGRPAGHRRSS
jgi:hypothetical protein